MIRYNTSKVDEFYKMSFIPYNDFDSQWDNSVSYACVEKGESEWLLRIKKLVAKQNVQLKLIYNEALEFDIDSDLFIPDVYIELLTVALTHKLALMYPRLDDAQMTRLEGDLLSAQNNVKTPKAESKMIIREYGIGDHSLTQNELMSGSFFLRG